MRAPRRWTRRVAALLAVGLIATACGNGDDGGGDEGAGEGESTEAGDGELETGAGVTEEPCPDAVNEDNGCIYLGILSDLTEGPFAQLAVEIVDGQRDFFQRINEDGGIAGYDVNIDEYTRDNRYNPQEQASAYREIEPEILALAQTLGTPPTEAILPDMDDDDMIGVPASWWSGWDFDESDNGLILNSGYSYCIESQIGLDWASGELGDVGSVMAVGYPGDYGEDAAVGVESWASANDAEYLGFTQTQPNAAVGNQDAAVGAILEAGPDVVQLGVGPAETGEIVAKAAAQGFEGQFLGSVPTWNPALLQGDAAEPLQAMYHHVGPWENFNGDSAAHEAMREAKGDELPANDGYTFGWIWSYPIAAAIEAAAEAGDLTRAGVREAVDGLEVDYEGALPTRTYGGDPNEDAPRVAVISRPNPDEPLGIETVEADVTGETADEYDYTETCASSV